MKCQSCKQSFGAGEGLEIGGAFYCYVCSIDVQPVAAIEAAPVQQSQPLAARVEVQEVRACRVAQMKAAFKTAQSAGLDTANGAKMRARLAKYLGRKVLTTRAALSPGEWAEVRAGIEAGVLTW